jgi:hypothetical protein
MDHITAHTRRSPLASLSLLLGALLLSSPYLVAADATPTADGSGVEGVWFPVVTVESFTARWIGAKIVVEWKTEIETHNAGFNLYRIEPQSGVSLRLNTYLIPSRVPQGSSGTTYQFVDPGGVTGEQVNYWLESIDVQGLPSYVGMITVQAPGHAPPGWDPPFRQFLPCINN